MRSFIYLMLGFLCSALIMVPELAFYYDWDLPNNGFPIAHLTNGAAYMAVFFHEIGHTLAAWMFGYPTIPVFDFVYGGGKTIEAPQTWPLIGFFWLVMFYILYDMRKKPLVFFLMAVFLSAHIIVTYKNLHFVFISFMGHGGELIVAAILFYRATREGIFFERGERVMSATVAWYLYMTNLRSFYGLMSSDVERLAYESQKGGLHLGDFSQISERLDIALESVTSFALGFWFMSFIFPFLVKFYLNWRSQRLDRIKKSHGIGV